jgi:hypothetical protein
MKNEPIETKTARLNAELWEWAKIEAARRRVALQVVINELVAAGITQVEQTRQQPERQKR